MRLYCLKCDLGGETSLVKNGACLKCGESKFLENVETKLEKLAKFEADNRARSKKYLDKIKAQGKRQVSIILDNNTIEILYRIREESMVSGNPLTFGDIIAGSLASNRHILEIERWVMDNRSDGIEQHVEENIPAKVDSLNKTINDFLGGIKPITKYNLGE